LVFDHLRLNDRIAGLIATYPLAEMFDAAAKGETDPKRFMPDFLKGDDVEVQNCRMTYEHGCIDLMIKSKVRFVAHRPSKLRIVGIFVGVSYLVGSAPSGEESEEMLMFEDAGGRLLWFPDFGVPDDLPSAVHWKLGSERLQPKDFRLTSTLDVSGKAETLLDVDWSHVTSNAPSGAFLKELEQVRPMSRNDFSRLFSALKLAKGATTTLTRVDLQTYFRDPLCLLKGWRSKKRLNVQSFSLMVHSMIGRNTSRVGLGE